MKNIEQCKGEWVLAMWSGIAIFFIILAIILAVLYFKYHENILGIISVTGLLLSAVSFSFSVYSEQLLHNPNMEMEEGSTEVNSQKTEVVCTLPEEEEKEIVVEDNNSMIEESEEMIIESEEVEKIQQTKSKCYLQDMDYYTSSNEYGSGFRYYDIVTDNLGTKYANGIGGNEQGENWQEYKLAGKYKELVGRVVLNYDYRSRTSDDVLIKIYGDDSLLYISPVISAGQEPIDFSIDVANVDILKVSIVGENLIRLVDCILYDTMGNGGQNYENSTLDKASVYLKDMDYLTSSNEFGSGFKFYETVKDNLGLMYGNGIGGSGQEENWQEYKLAGQYKEFIGRIVLNYERRSQTNDDVLVKIYGDDSLLYISPIINAGREPIDFIIDVSNVDKLKVSIVGEHMIRLVDCTLYNTNGNEKKEYGKNISEKNKVALYTLDYFFSSNVYGEAFVNYSSVKDNLNNIYADGIGGVEGEENWQEYKLYGSYSRIQGKIILNYDYRENTSDQTYVKIYGDSEILYISPLITAGQEVVEFDVGIENVDKLRISIVGKNMIRIAECYLLK